MTTRRAMVGLLVLGCAALLLAWWDSGGSARRGGTEDAKPSRGSDGDSKASAKLPGGDEWRLWRGDTAQSGVASGWTPPRAARGPDGAAGPPRVLWTFDLGAPVKASAVVASGKVYVGCDSGRFVALDAASGGVKWEAKLGGAIEGAAAAVRARGPDGKQREIVVVGAGDGLITALDAADGGELWRVETDDKAIGAPAPIFDAGGAATRLVAGSYDRFLRCFDAAGGAVVWKYETGSYINGSPALTDGRAVFGGCDAKLHMVLLDNGAKLAEVDAGAYIAGSAAVAGERAYFGHYGNEFVAVDLAKAEVAWRYTDREFPFFSSPATDGRLVVFGGRDRRLHAVRAATGEGVWKFRAGARVDSSPVIAGGWVIVGSSDGRLYALTLNEGTEVWSVDLGKEILGSPALANGRVYIGTDEGKFHALGW